MYSCTKTTSYGVGQWLGTGPEFTVVDTPGFGDGDGEDETLLEEMMDILANTIEHADTILLLLKGGQTRFSDSLQTMLKRMTIMFGKDWWDHVVVGISFWTYDEFHVKRRKCHPNYPCKNEAWFEEQINSQLCQKLHVCQNFTYVFADSWSQTPGPPGFNKDDQLQQDHWQIETGKLWEITTTRTQRFDFQTIDDILEENARQKREIQQLNDVISNDIAQLNQKLATATSEAKDYTNTKVATATNEAKKYTNTKVATATGEAKYYTNTKVTTATNEAKDYTNTRVATATSEAKKYTNSEVATAKGEVKDYTNTKVTTATNGAKDYTNTKIATATDKAKKYTNSKVATAQIQLNQNLVPLGTITAWVTKPTMGTTKDEIVNLPDGWVRCNGGTIPQPSIWAGQLTPNLNGEKRFLRGASDSEVLTMEEDQMQDHKHDISDPGHDHSYNDKYPNWGGDDQGYKGPGTFSDSTNDRFDKSHARTTGETYTNMAVEGISYSYRHGAETRPKNMNVIYIMRVW